MKNILLVDDEDFFRERLNQAFVRRGYTTSTASCYDEAMVIIRKEQPAMAVVDLKCREKVDYFWSRTLCPLPLR